MILFLLMPAVLMSVCFLVHALAMASLLRHLRRSAGSTSSDFWPGVWMLVQIALWMLSAHLLEIAVWASFFVSQQVFPDFRTAFYFSSVTYTTVGYGDIILPENWRLFAGAEGLTGILLCGWSTGVLYAVVSAIYFARSTEARDAQKTGKR